LLLRKRVYLLSNPQRTTDGDYSPPPAQIPAGAAGASAAGKIDCAQRQSAKFWELPAATSLARLWRDQGKRAEARDLLAPVYG